MRLEKCGGDAFLSFILLSTELFISAFVSGVPVSLHSISDLLGRDGTWAFPSRDLESKEAFLT